MKIRGKPGTPHVAPLSNVPQAVPGNADAAGPVSVPRQRDAYAGVSPASSAEVQRPRIPARLQAPLNVHPSEPCQKNEVMVCTYNVENLFDAHKDPVHDDGEFTPEGEKNWTEEKVTTKVRNLGRVIRAMNGGQGPDILALTEVENAGMTERLRREGLQGLGYQTLVHLEGPDHRGIDNAILSKHPLVGPPKLHQVHDPNHPAWQGHSTRGVLEATLDVKGVRVTVLVNHWPSRRGGAPSAVRRDLIARRLQEIVTEITRRDPQREVVVLGDFNSEMDDPVFRQALPTSRSDDEEGLLADTRTVQQALIQRGRLPKRPDKEEGFSHPEMGTHYYNTSHSWSSLDHILITHSLLDNHGLAWVPGSTQTVREDFMTTKGGAPLRFFQPGVDPRHQPMHKAGYSDHLPVVARLRRV